MKLDSTTESRNSLVEESLSFMADIRDFVRRNQWVFEWCDEIDRAAELLVADLSERLEESKRRLQADRAALVEAEVKRDQIKQGTAQIRLELRNASRETGLHDSAIRDAAVQSGYPYVIPLVRIVKPINGEGA